MTERDRPERRLRLIKSPPEMRPERAQSTTEKKRPEGSWSAMTASAEAVGILHWAAEAVQDIEMSITSRGGEAYPEDPTMRIPDSLFHVQVRSTSGESEKEYWEMVAMIKADNQDLHIPPQK